MSSPGPPQALQGNTGPSMHHQTTAGSAERPLTWHAQGPAGPQCRRRCCHQHHRHHHCWQHRLRQRLLTRPAAAAAAVNVIPLPCRCCCCRCCSRVNLPRVPCQYQAAYGVADCPAAPAAPSAAAAALAVPAALLLLPLQLRQQLWLHQLLLQLAELQARDPVAVAAGVLNYCWVHT